MTIGDTDVVPGGGEQDERPQYGFLARVIGLPVLEARLLVAIEELIGTSQADKEALAASVASLRDSDRAIDRIEPEPFNQTKSKKGTKP